MSSFTSERAAEEEDKLGIIGYFFSILFYIIVFSNHMIENQINVCLILILYLFTIVSPFY